MPREVKKGRVRKGIKKLGEKLKGPERIVGLGTEITRRSKELEQTNMKNFWEDPLWKAMIHSDIAHKHLIRRKTQEIRPGELEGIAESLLEQEIRPKYIEKVFIMHGHHKEKIEQALKDNGYLRKEGKWVKKDA